MFALKIDLIKCLIVRVYKKNTEKGDRFKVKTFFFRDHYDFWRKIAKC